MNSLRQYLVEKLIHENHPTVEYDNCINSRQRRKTCTVCSDVCPKDVIGHSQSIQWESCDNCNICVTQCPSRAIRPSVINLGELLGIYDSEAEHSVIACRHMKVEADLKLYCIASIPWEAIAWLTLEKQVIFLKHGCEDCQEHGCLSVFEDTLIRVEKFLGADKYRERIRIAHEDELPPAKLMSRRELLALFGKRTKNMVGSVLPDDGSVKIDGMLYRNLLTKRLKRLYDSGREQAFGWYTRTFTDTCWGCGICAKVCPRGAISVVEADGKKYMAHTLWKCVGCGICESVCLEGSMSGSRIEYIINPLQSVLTEISYDTCELCGNHVKTGAGGLCVPCAVKGHDREGQKSSFVLTAHN